MVLEENETHPQHVIDWHNNITEVEKLVSIHIEMVGSSRGRKGNIEVLNKSGIVLLTACWETFIESLVCNAFNFLLENAKSHKVFPNHVLIKASKALKEDPDERKVWGLAEDGWKNVMREYKNMILNKEIDYFHVPNARNIDELFLKLLGIKNITSHWSWKGKVNKDAIRNLDKLIELRGAIAHKVKTDMLLRKNDVNYYINFLNDVAVITHNTVAKHIYSKIRILPWDIYSYQRHPK